jgi:hypothetical protein
MIEALERRLANLPAPKIDVDEIVRQVIARLNLSGQVNAVAKVAAKLIKEESASVNRLQRNRPRRGQAG